MTELIPFNSYPSLRGAPISSPSRLVPRSFLLTRDIALTEAQLTDGACSSRRSEPYKKGKDLQTQADCKR